MIARIIEEGEYVPPPAEFGRDERGRIFLIGPKKEKEDLSEKKKGKK